ncbi:cell division protease FtsH [Devosia sp. UYZn731]|uniref:AAA family ATPase n=1 Tax=Devosia sp. UYZn731 TaxID=3156345 RepID=UPI0033953D32
MANRRTPEKRGADVILGVGLARQLLNGLRQRASAELKYDTRSEAEEVALAEKMQANMRLPADKAAYAIALGYCLAPYFPTVEDLMATKAFLVVRCRPGDDAERVGEVLSDATPHRVRAIAHNPHYALEGDVRLLVLDDVGVRYTDRMVRPIAQAAERCIPIFCTLAADDPVPAALAGAELMLDLPPMTPEMLALLFEAAHDEVPQGVLSLTSADKLRTADLVAHIRRARPAAACLSGLLQVVSTKIEVPKPATVRLDDLAGYGEAKAWGLELAQDMKLWREGKLDWDEVDHRAVVLDGPPGTGKTSFASVLAGSLDVPLIASNVAEWNGHKHLSGTLNRMKEVFAEATTKAPCVLLIDEIDGISSRSQLAGEYVEYWTQIVNLMLVLVTDATNTPGVVIVGATNHVERIDPALMRAGRLDRIIRIELPDAEAIAAILARYIGAGVEAKDLSLLAHRLVGQTGADIEKLVRAARASARRAGRMFSVAEIAAQVPDPLNKLLPRVRRRIAIYRNGQRIVAQVLGLAEMAPNAGDFTRQLEKALSEERFHTEQTCNDVLAVIMAGRAAEEIVFGDVSTFGSGIPSSDLAVATAIAKDLELKTGFGECGVIYLDGDDHRLSTSTPAAASVRRRIEAALARASAVLLENVDELERVDGRGTTTGWTSGNVRLLH